MADMRSGIFHMAVFVGWQCNIPLPWSCVYRMTINRPHRFLVLRIVRQPTTQQASRHLPGCRVKGYVHPRQVCGKQ
ncbi:hypothetical protein DO72_5169 [Burkholderia pseudomallei]|nr:hypothetical protein DO72_5169 [Burkholderia pseudomallei]